MNEEEFAQSIDCCFPYFDETEWKRIITLGAELSPDSAFMVLHEICRPPRSSEVTPDQLRLIASYWIQHFNHPLAQRVHQIALKMIAREELSISEVLSHFAEIKRFPNQYNALAIAYFSCDDTDGVIEAPYDEIVQSWQSTDS